MFFSYIAFWSSCRVTPDLGEVHARRAEFGHVFPEGRNLEGGMLRRRNPGRNSPEDRIKVWVFKKRTNSHLSLIITCALIFALFVMVFLVKSKKAENKSKSLNEWDKIKEYGEKINEKNRNKRK